MAVQIQLRRGTAAEWTTADPTLAQGEAGLETDTGNLKFGDGATPWSGLDYAFDLDGKVDRAGDTMTGALTLPGDAVADLEAVPKQQLDATVDNVTSQKVDKAGDTMTGRLTVENAAPEYRLQETDATNPDDYFQFLGGAGLLLVRKFDATAGSPVEFFRFGGDTADAYMQLFQPLRLPSGSASDPSVRFASNLTTGLYLVSTDVLGLSAGGALRARVSGVGIQPGADDVFDLGTSALRWKDVWATNGTIQTSDADSKDGIADTRLGKDFARRVRPVEFTFTDGERPHQGFVAQEVKQVLTDLGIADSAAFIDPAVDAQRREAEGPPAQDADESDTDYAARVEEWQADIDAEKAAPKGLRYSELIPPLYRALQEQQDEIDDLRARLEALEAKA